MAKHKPSPDAVSEDTPVAEGYTVLARRYRPQAFDQLVGQEHVARALENAIKSNRVAHAYLFTGARGVGKTSSARILAKCLNCEQGPTVTPCNQCTMCQSIATGEDTDVLEIDGASNGGVEKVRELRSNVQYRPSRGRYKIYIIDEVHMLTTAAFNALLKTLEEPPPHVKFIFATTEAQKIPITILSRCQRFDFAGIGVNQIVERLRDIVQREGMQADEDALEMIARRAGGSMRDAQSLLDQLLAFGSERLTADQIHALLGTAGDDSVAELAAAVLARDSPRAVELLGEIAQKTLQPGELFDQLMAYWRDLMVAHVAGTEAKDLSIPSRHRETLLQQAKELSLDGILAGLEVLNNARARLRATSHGRILLEMALVRLCRLEDLTAVSQLAQLVSQVSAGQTPTAAGPTVRAAPPEGLKKKLTEAPPNGEQKSVLSLDAANLPVLWPHILQTLPQIMGSQLGKGGLPAISGPNTLVFRFPLAYNGERALCSVPERLEHLEAILAKSTGKAWKVRIEVDPNSDTEQIPTPGPSRPVEENGLTKQRRLREEAENAPLIKRAIELLGAQVVRVDDDFNAQPAPEPLTERVQQAPPAEELMESEEA